MGVDYIQSITAAQGFQSFKNIDSSPGIDIHGKLNFHSMTFIAEYTAALQPVNIIDHDGKKPKTIYYEMGYSTTTFHKKSSVAIGYGQSYQSTQFNFPLKTMNAAYNIALSSYFILSAQYQHNINYSLSNLGYSPPDKNLILIRLMAYF